ncbi:MAG: transcriptional regulator NrdR [Candidatus Nanoarchaeia archaeon]
MKCPYCEHNDSKVVETRVSEDAALRRRRECIQCSKRYTTYERVELIDLHITKKNGSKERFDREKLFKGLSSACSKRLSNEQIGRIVDNVESNLRKRKKVEIPSETVGKIVMRKLKSIDKVAYLRFASVYQNFDDVQDFEQEVKTLMR